MGRSKAAKARDAGGVSDPRIAAMTEGAFHDAGQAAVVEAHRRADIANPKRTQPGWKTEGSMNTMLKQGGYSADERRTRISNMAQHLDHTYTHVTSSAPLHKQLSNLSDHQFGQPHSVDVDFSEQHYKEKGPVKTHRVTVLAHTGQDALHTAHDMVKAKGHYVHGTRHVEADRI